MPQYALKTLLAAAVLVTPLMAQRGGRSGLPMLSPTSRPFAPSFSHQSSYRPGFYLGTPFLPDDYSSYAQPVFILQTQPEASQKPAPAFDEPKPAPPLMIELQGDHYVRRTADATTASARQPDYAGPSTSSSPARLHSAPPTSSVTEPPPAIFVFRDGHREESSDYSIISGVIYSRGNYWTTGSWSRKIQIADLNVPATLEANREHGVPFRLPSAPNEVETRP
jgi:hypothetical protein